MTCSSDGIRRRENSTEGIDFMIPENTDTPLTADCPSAPCSAFASPTMNAMAAPGGDPKKIDYPTPLDWFTYLNLEFGFTLDPCCAHGTAKCKKYYTEEDDGLNKSWADERVFMNPPYGRHIGPWMQKAYEESKRGALVVCFVPARVDTNWWHDYAIKGEVRLPKGRVKNTGGGAWPFPVAVVIFRPRLHSLPNLDGLTRYSGSITIEAS
jgi:phage N-6-adenine-methyltransferase